MLSRRQWIGCVLSAALLLVGRAAAAEGTPLTKVPASLAEARQLEHRVQEVTQRVMPTVVGLMIGGHQGSGVIVSEDGYVLTAGHVSGTPAGKEAIITLPDGKQVKGKTLGSNKEIDSGMVKITTEGKWPVAKKGDSTALQKGQWVIALGHPGGYQNKRPPVLRLGRVIEANSKLIQTDCTLVGGDSGGPLFDLDGNVIGIHSRIGFGIGYNIHVPMETYIETWDKLAEGETWGKQLAGGGFGGMGRQFETLTPAKLGLSFEKVGDRMKVVTVTKDSFAEKAGFKPRDYVARIEGTEVSSRDAIDTVLQKKKPGDEIVVEVLRGAERLSLKLKVEREYVQKTNPQILGVMAPVVAKTANAVVRIRTNDKEAALGTIVRADGWIITKFSELKGDPVCELKDGRKLPAKVVGINKEFDLAALKVEATGLPVAEWRPSSEAAVGSWVLTVGQTKEPAAIGVVSVGRRSISRKDIPPGVRNPNSGFLGVTMANSDKGVRVTLVQEGSAADKAGVKKDDVILGVNNHTVQDMDEVMDLLGDTKPGDEVTLRLVRGDETKELKAVLGKRDAKNMNRGDMQNQMGSSLSAKRVGFPEILQHDTVVRPADCGGPLVDLDGKVVGVNIARAGRTESYAIPSEVVQTLLPDLIAGKVPPPQTVSVPKKPSAAERLKAAEDARARALAAKLAADKQLAAAEDAVKKAKAELDAEKKAVEKKADEPKK